MTIPSQKNYNFYQDIYQNSVNCIRPTQILSCRGKSLLSSEDDLDNYLALYGGHHYYKLKKAFESLDFIKFNNEIIEIIDWGCGQAIGTCIFIECLVENGIQGKIFQVTLVEPSKTALNRGYNFVCKFLGNNNERIPIHTIPYDFDNLRLANLPLFSKKTIKFHIFSNILDVKGFSIQRLFNLVQHTFTGINYFVCTTPYNGEATRVDEFYNRFSVHQLESLSHSTSPVYGDIYLCRDNKFARHRITRYERVFVVDLPE